MFLKSNRLLPSPTNVLYIFRIKTYKNSGRYCSLFQYKFTKRVLTDYTLLLILKSHFKNNIYFWRGSVKRFRELLLYQITPRNPLIHIFFQCCVCFQEFVCPVCKLLYIFILVLSLESGGANFYINFDVKLRFVQRIWAADTFSLTLIWMAGGIFDAWNFEQKQLTMAWSRNTFYPRSITQKCVRSISILLKLLCKKILF
jgi:hypothetical protein